MESKGYISELFEERKTKRALGMRYKCGKSGEGNIFMEKT